MATGSLQRFTFRTIRALTCTLPCQASLIYFGAPKGWNIRPMYKLLMFSVWDAKLSGDYLAPSAAEIRVLSIEPLNYWYFQRTQNLNVPDFGLNMVNLNT